MYIGNHFSGTQNARRRLTKTDKLLIRRRPMVCSQNHFASSFSSFRFFGGNFDVRDLFDAGTTAHVRSFVR